MNWNCHIKHDGQQTSHISHHEKLIMKNSPCRFCMNYRPKSVLPYNSKDSDLFMVWYLLLFLIYLTMLNSSIYIFFKYYFTEQEIRNFVVEMFGTIYMLVVNLSGACVLYWATFLAQEQGSSLEGEGGIRFNRAVDLIQNYLTKKILGTLRKEDVEFMECPGGQN